MIKKIFVILMFIFPSVIFAAEPAQNFSNMENTGIVLQRAVFYSQPSEQSTPSGAVIKNLKIEILRWTGKQETIRGFIDEWAEIKLLSGKKGFIFGAYLFDMKKLFLVTWKQISRDGKTKNTFVFKKDMTFVYEGFTKNEQNDEFKKTSSKGNYTITNSSIRLSSPTINIELYFFRYKGKNALSGLMFSLDNNVPADLLYTE